MTATMPRVLDRAGRARATTVHVIDSPLTEFLVGLQTFQFEEAAHTFDVGVEWFDDVRTRASGELTGALAALGLVGWGNLLGKALAEAWPGSVPDLIDRVETMDARELWLLFAAFYLPPFSDGIDPATFRQAADGDPDTRKRLAAVAVSMFGEKEDDLGVYRLGAEEHRSLLGVAMRRWYRDVFARQEADAVAILARDADAKRRLRRSTTDDKLIEQATNGLVYVPEAWVRRVILTPHLAMRPWNVTCAYDDAYVLCYPVADESLGVDRAAPPSHLIRLHKALADDKRLRILKLLATADRSLQEIADAIGLAKSTAHHHTVILRSAGLIRTSTEVDNRYSLRRESIAEAGPALAEFIEGGAS
jgi:DNA-binding transcriptional ArsR family regulator